MSLRLLLTTDAVGGVWTYALELARALGRWGVTTHLAVLGPGPDGHQLRAAHAIPSVRLRAAPYALEWTDDPWDDVDASGAWLLGLADEIEPDVVHLNGYTHGALPFRAPKVVVAHSCVLSWWRAVKGEEAPERYATYRRRVAEGLAAADAVVAPTRAFLDEVLVLYGARGDAEVVPNGILLPSSSPSVDRDPVVLAAGRVWDPAKGLDVLDAVAADVPWAVQVAGHASGPVRGLDGPRRAEALGSLSRTQLCTRMSRAAVFCHPARYEPFGLAPLEAAAAGCALVLGDLPTLREVWGDAAVYVPPGDEGALREALTRLTASPDEVRRLASAAAARARCFDVATQAEAMLGVYRRLLAARSPRARAAAAAVEACP